MSNVVHLPTGRKARPHQSAQLFIVAVCEQCGVPVFVHRVASAEGGQPKTAYFGVCGHPRPDDMLIHEPLGEDPAQERQAVIALAQLAQGGLETTRALLALLTPEQLATLAASSAAPTTEPAPPAATEGGTTSE
ncbi:MAG: hypothetical protein IT340_20160 [Chloroflexi bacterium]|nr:hypothetical protein [Chloroflexota bacterium]